MELNRTSWKRPADLDGNNNVESFGHLDHLEVRFLFDICSVSPAFDCSAAILVPLISYAGAVTEDSDNGLRVVNVGCFEISGNGRR